MTWTPPAKNNATIQVAKGTGNPVEKGKKGGKFLTLVPKGKGGDESVPNQGKAMITPKKVEETHDAKPKAVITPKKKVEESHLLTIKIVPVSLPSSTSNSLRFSDIFPALLQPPSNPRDYLRLRHNTEGIGRKPLTNYERTQMPTNSHGRR